MSVDITNIKEQVQSILEAANTTTASQPLSSGMSTKVNSVLKIHPQKIPIQASLYPVVTMFVDSKEVELLDIAKDQLSGRRRAVVDLKVIGAVWNSTVTNLDEDNADNDCEDLMENIEQILRANSTLNGAVAWASPTDVTYHSVTLAEDAHLRAGMLNLRCKIHY